MFGSQGASSEPTTRADRTTLKSKINEQISDTLNSKKMTVRNPAGVACSEADGRGSPPLTVVHAVVPAGCASPAPAMK